MNRSEKSFDLKKFLFSVNQTAVQRSRPDGHLQRDTKRRGVRQLSQADEQDDSGAGKTVVP